MKTTKIAVGLGVVLALSTAMGCGQDEAGEESNSEDAVVGVAGNVDQAGIVESTTIMLTTAFGLPLSPALDDYNQADPFRIVGANRFKDAFTKNFAQFDLIDGKRDWNDKQAAQWVARLMSSNYQVIDTSKPCDYDNPHTYLEIERAVFLGKEHQTCGGRMLNEDALDVTLNFLVRGPAASSTGEDALSDGVDQATHKGMDTFPYLAEWD